MRLVGLSREIWGLFPPEYVPIASAITAFGSAEVLIVLLAVLYWVADRRQTARVAAYTVCGAAIILLLKGLIAEPRPPETLWRIAAEDDPWGFPSGHAFISVVVYGGLITRFRASRDAVALSCLSVLLVVLTVAGVGIPGNSGAGLLVGAVVGLATGIGLRYGTERGHIDLEVPSQIALATGLAGLLIVLVALSRVVLGVHYLGDLLVGALLGGVLLIGLEKTIGEDLKQTFGVAVVAATAMVVIVSGTITQSWSILGFAIGGLVVSWFLNDIPEVETSRGATIVGVVGLIVMVVGLGLREALTGIGVIAVEFGPLTTLRPAAVVVHAILFVGIFLTPLIVDRMNRPTVA